MGTGSSTAEGSYTIYYHGSCTGFTGRAFSPLCILEAAKAKYEMKEVADVPKDSNTFACPMCSFPDGCTIAQTGAICIALGKDLGLAPSGAIAERKSLQLVMDVGDMMSDCLGKKGCERVMKWVNHFEVALGDKPYMMGDKVTYVDYTAMGVFALFPLKDAKVAEDFKGVEMTPKVKAWYEKMSADEAVKKVLAISAFLPDQYV